MTGYDLKKVIDESVGNFWHESPRQLYPQLKKLTDLKLVILTETELEKGRRKRSYAITDAVNTANISILEHDGELLA